MKVKTIKKAGPVFVADAEQLQAALREKRKDLLVLTGQLVVSSLNGTGTNTVEGYLPQAPRSSPTALPFMKGRGKSLSVWLQKESHASLSRQSARTCYAVDALLRYGQRHKKVDDLLVLSAAGGTRHTFVLALRFKKGVLESVSDYELSPPSAHTFEADLHVLLERLQLQFMSSTFHWCGPLDRPKAHSYVLVPESVWSLAPVQKLSTGSSGLWLQRHGWAALIILASGAGYVGALYTPYVKYTVSAQSLATESARLKGQYTFASDRLQLLRAQRDYFEATKANPQRLALFEAVLASVSDEKGSRMLEAKLYWPLSDEQKKALGIRENVDFELKLEVPLDPDKSALDQSIPLLHSLSDKLGMNLRLAPDGMGNPVVSGSTPTKGAKRSYRILGDFPRV